MESQEFNKKLVQALAKNPSESFEDVYDKLYNEIYTDEAGEDFRPSLEQYKGKAVIVMTPTTHYWIGILRGYDAFSIYLRPCAWIPNVGRHNEVLGSGKPDERTEVEPHPLNKLTAVTRPGSMWMAWNGTLRDWMKAK